MPSPRPSPALRPTSPLSPRYEPRYESLGGALHQHARTAAPGNTQRRRQTSSMKLPSLPRFHPANFPSQHTSASTTPSTGMNSPQNPASPMQQQRLYSEAQKQLYLFQKETIAANTGFVATREKPASPRLEPLGSPGPVTPLELEGPGGYLVAGALASGQNNLADRHKDLVEKLIEQEALRHSESLKSSQCAPAISTT